VRRSPRLGAEIIEAVPFPYPVAPLILCHHERWDGRGYPSRPAGRWESPSERASSAVVDCFDLADETAARIEVPWIESPALEILRYEAGKSLDPAVVDAYIETAADPWRAARHAKPLSETASCHGPVKRWARPAGHRVRAPGKSVALYEPGREPSAEGLGVHRDGAPPGGRDW